VTRVEFERETARLDRQWPRTYSAERFAMIWKEFNLVDPGAFTGMVDRWIGELRQAPMLNEMREDLARWREREHEKRRREERQDAKDFWLGTYQPDDVKTITQYIIKRMKGGVNDADWTMFVKHLDEAAAGSEQMAMIKARKGVS
jgi:hypothetical protein